jgi:DNA/RNA-binding protein KIN17
MIEYIDKDPKAMARAEEEKKRKRVEMDDEEMRKKQIAAQVKAAGSEGSLRVGEALVRTKDDEKISLAMGVAGPGNSVPRLKKARLVRNAFWSEGDEEDAGAPAAETPAATIPSSSASAALLMQEEERRKSQQLQAEDSKNRKEHWLHPGIQVRVKHKSLLGGRFYDKKGTVVGVVDNFAGDVLVEEATVRLDQSDLQTVLPKAGRDVLIVNGRCRGCKARLLEIKAEQYTCVLSVLEGPFVGMEIRDVEYEDVCKLSS